MSTKRCFVKGCTDYKQKNTSFHRFPTDEGNKWAYLIRNINNQENAYEYNKHSVVCGWHFSPHFKCLVGNRVQLRADAYPTLFEGYDDNVYVIDDTEQLLSNNSGQYDSECWVDTETINAETTAPSRIPNEMTITFETPTSTVTSFTEGILNIGFSNSEDCDEIVSNKPSSQLADRTSSMTSTSTKRQSEPCVDSSSTKRFRYFGDFKNKKLTTPEEQSEALGICERTIMSAKKKIKNLHQKIWRKNKQIRSLKELLTTLQTKYKLSPDAVSHLSMNYTDNILNQLAKGKSKKEYSDEVKAFACTLNFYSRSAYEYIRTKFGKHLPHPNTIQAWYKCVDGSTGISELALKILQDRVAEKNGGKVFVSLIIDEMSIRVLKFWNNGLHKWEGLVDFGNEYITADDTPASKVLVFLVNEINGHGKVPVAHYFTHSVSGDMLRTLVLNALEQIHKTGVIVMSVTFDGPQNNIAMAHLLGGNVWNPDDLRCSFPHPITNDPVFLFLDVVHMIKLIRNTFGTKGIIFDDEKKAIKWEYIVKLVEFQQEEKLAIANKIRRRHVNFKNEKMKVCLATQTFSESVAVALEFCLTKKLPQFAGCEPTIRFIRIFNKLFDILNSRNLTVAGFKKGISAVNCTSYFDFFNEAKSYIRKLTVNKKDSILKSKNRTGFMGFLTAMESTTGIFNLYITQKKDLKFLLMYNFTQDPLETLFGVVRGKRGADNNPTTKQFEDIFKRLLMNNEIRRFSKNCNTMDDNIPLFTSQICVSQINKNVLTSDETELVAAEVDYQLDEEDFLGTVLTEVTVDIVVYIAGFVERRLKKEIKCHDCLHCLNDETTSSELINLKNKGGLIYPQKNVVNVCKEVEKLIRFLDFKELYFYEKVRLMCFRSLSYTNVFENMTSHIMEQTVIDNHKTLMISAIINLYIKIRMHHEGKAMSEELNLKRIRSKNSKLILFAGQ